MKQEMEYDFPANADYIGEWMPVRLTAWRDKPFTASTLQVRWCGVEPNAGTIRVKLSNDGANSTTLAALSPAQADNSDDVTIYEINTLAEFIGLSYTANSDSPGHIIATIYYHND